MKSTKIKPASTYRIKRDPLKKKCELEKKSPKRILSPATTTTTTTTTTSSNKHLKVDSKSSSHLPNRVNDIIKL